MLTAKPEPLPVPHTFNQSLQLLSPTAQLLPDPGASAQWLATRWSIVNAHDSALRTSYGFDFQMQSATGTALHSDHNCTMTSTWAGDQLFDIDHYKVSVRIPAHIMLQVSTFISQPQTLALGPLTGFTYYENNNAGQTLLTDDGKNRITIPTIATTG